MEYIRLQAHKGVELTHPENTMASFRAAQAQGYDMFELDLRVTKDGQIVVLHNKTINKTARWPDGSALENEVSIYDLTYADTMRYDFGIWRGEQFRGEPLPLFSEVLEFAGAHRIPLKIDNKIKQFTPEQLTQLYTMLRESGAPVNISCWSLESAEKAVREIPQAEIHFDGELSEELLRTVNAMVGRDRFMVWLAVDRCMAEWAPEHFFITPEIVEKTLPYARISLWAVKDAESFRNACRRWHPYAVETIGTIRPADRDALLTEP